MRSGVIAYGQRVLRVEQVSVAYGPVPALVDVDLEVGAGEVVALVGANGSGRTTLLRTVSGLLRPRSGRVLLDGELLSGTSPAAVVARGVAHVPQGRRVFGAMTVRENLLVGAHLTSGRALDEVLALFPVLSERSGQAAGTLSGGEQQQLAFGRALMAEPRVLLLDEPTTGLSPLAAADLLGAVRTVRDRGTAVLLVEQAEPALRAADRGVVLEAGRVVLRGPAADLLADDGVRRAHLG